MTAADRIDTVAHRAIEIALPLVAEYEGFRSRAYRCPAGVWTIGYGSTAGVREGDTITREAALQRLREELHHFMAGVQRLLRLPATPHQLAAMTSLAFNIGLGAFAKSSVLRLHNAGDPVAAARAFELWNKAGGRVLPGLVRRRAAEAALYLTPEPEAIKPAPQEQGPEQAPRLALVDEEPPPRVDPEEPPPLPMPQAVDPERPLTQSRIVQGASLSGGVAGLTLAAEGARAVADIRSSLADWLPYIALAVVVAVAGWIIWERVQQRRRGIA